jgi:hypothetical protein
MKEKQLLTKELGAKIYSIIYLIAFLFYLIFIGIDIFTPLEDKTFDLLGNFLLYAGSGFFAIIGFGNLTLFKK